jgi:hypothetical protein
MKNILIFTLIIFLVMVGGSVFYRYVIYLPKVEQQKVEQEQLKIERQATRELEINNEYDQCIEEAKENFINKMHNSCSESAKQHNLRYEKCLESGEGLLRSLCESELKGYQDPDPLARQCSIPKSIGDNLISEREKLEAKCLNDREFQTKNNK